MASMSTADSASISGRKRSFHAAIASNPTEFRSGFPRRDHVPLFPNIERVSSDALLDVAENEEEEGESTSSCFQSDVSHESKVIGSSVSGAPLSDLRRITQTYSRRIKEGRSGRDPKRSKVEVSKRDSAIGTEVSEILEAFPRGNSKKKAPASKVLEKEPEISDSSCLGSITDVNGGGTLKSATDEAAGRSQISRNSVAPIKKLRRDRDLDSDLACSERIPNEGEEEEEESSEYSTCNEMTLSEIEEELFGLCSSEAFISDNNSSSSSELVVSSSSSDGFSEKTLDRAAPSATFSLFLQLARQFLPSSFSMDPGTQFEAFEEFTLMRFEDEEDEESYRRLRSRERRDAAVHNYAEEYSNTTNDGGLILEQRIVMINWMVEHSSAMELQSETLFLGVSLMDRFLSRGYFKSEKNLQLLGIACVTLATRIEENQPYNSIRQISFKVGNNYYSRGEVVAMEWVVQDVLRYKCLLPTTHHFLWFYLKAARADANVQNLSKYLAVLSLLDHERLSYWPSSIAAGLVILACLATNHDDSCQMVMETHVRTKNDDLPECMQSLQWLVKYAC
nr:PREDICTED: cyclin-SDS-like [Musa acuminata subsp. malaccensis]